MTTAISWRRRRSFHERPLETLPETGTTDPGDGVSAQDALWNELAALPPRQRAAIVLRYYEDLSESQTAEVMGCSVGTVKSQVSTGLARLRAQAGRDVAPLGPEVDDDGEADSRPLVYAEGSILHVGSRKIDTGLTPAETWASAGAVASPEGAISSGRDERIPDSKIMNALYMTDEGAVFTTLDGRIWFSDGTSVQHIGGVPWTPKQSDTRQIAPQGALVDASIETDDAGSRVAWLERASGDQIDLVVYETAERAVHARLALPLPPRADAQFEDVYGEHRGIYGDHVYWNRHTGGSGPVQTQLMRTVVSTSTHEPATQRMLAAERQGKARMLVIGSGDNAQAVSAGSLSSSDPDDPNFRLSGSRLEVGLFDQESQDVAMPIFDPVSGGQLRFRAPANLQIDKLVLFEWFDEDRFVLSTRPAWFASERRDIVVCRISTEQCEITLRKEPGQWLVLPRVGIPG